MLLRDENGKLLGFRTKFEGASMDTLVQKTKDGKLLYRFIVTKNDLQFYRLEREYDSYAHAEEDLENVYHSFGLLCGNPLWSLPRQTLD